jgi:membrane protein
VNAARIARAARRVPDVLRRADARAWRDRVLGLSAEAAFWQLLSLPSLFLALVATLGYVSRWSGDQTQLRIEQRIESALGHAFSPHVVQEVIHPTLHEVLFNGRADVISIGFALALWAGSSATATFVNTITIAYDMRDLRGPVRSRLLALRLFLASVVIGVVVLPLLVLGPGLLVSWLPHDVRATAGQAIHLAYYPALVLLLLFGLATLYHLAPPRRLPWHRGLPGAVVAILVFLGGSALLRAYIGFILDRNHAYGTLASPIAALLFFFVLALGVLYGAEVNAVIEQLTPAPPRRRRIFGVRRWKRLNELPAAALSSPEDPGDARTGDSGADPVTAAVPHPARTPVVADEPAEEPHCDSGNAALPDAAAATGRDRAVAPQPGRTWS